MSLALLRQGIYASARQAAGAPAITQVQKRSVHAATVTSASLSFNTTPTPGNLLIACFGGRGDEALSLVSTTSGWTAVHDPWVFSDPPTSTLNVFSNIYRKIAASGDTGFSFTVSNHNSALVNLHIFEYAGLQSAVNASAFTNITGSQTEKIAGPVTTTQPNALLLAYWAAVASVGGDQAVTDSFAIETTEISSFAAARIVSATGTYETTGSWATARRNNSHLVAFAA